MWIPIRALRGDPAFGDGSDYGGGRRCPGEYCDSARGVKLVKGHLRSFTLPAVAVAVAGGLSIFRGSAPGQASSSKSGGSVKLRGDPLFSFFAVPLSFHHRGKPLGFNFLWGFF